jgi:hypothetical protein
MLGFFVLFVLIVAVVAWFKSYYRKTLVKVANDPKLWQEWVIKSKVTPQKQDEIQRKYGTGIIPLHTESSSARDFSLEVRNPQRLAEFEESLTTIWAGSTKTIEFTYEKPFERGRSRRRVDVEELMYDAKGRIILRGHCHKRGEERTFREDRILTKIKCGSKRYDFDEWCEELLGVDLYEVVPVR